MVQLVPMHGRYKFLTSLYSKYSNLHFTCNFCHFFLSATLFVDEFHPKVPITTTATYREWTEKFTRHKHTPRRILGSKTCGDYCKGILICQKIVFHEEIYIFLKINDTATWFMRNGKKSKCWDFSESFSKYAMFDGRFQCQCAAGPRISKNPSGGISISVSKTPSNIDRGPYWPSSSTDRKYQKWCLWGPRTLNQYQAGL